LSKPRKKPLGEKVKASGIMKPEAFFLASRAGPAPQRGGCQKKSRLLGRDLIF
jgi:hypothetical protein